MGPTSAQAPFHVVKETTRSASRVRIVRASVWLCLGGAALGALGLLGWASGVTALTTIVPGLPPMMPRTALALVLIGGSGAAYRRDDRRPWWNTLSVLATLAVLALGVSQLAEYALGINPPLDRILPRIEPTLSLGRSSPLTALALTCLAAAVFLSDVRPNARVSPSQWLILCAALAAFTGLTGILLRAAPLYRLPRTPVIGLSLPTAVSLLLTSMGLLLARPTSGVMRVATSPGPGGILLRRLALPVVIAPLLLGLVVTRLSGARAIVEVSVPVAILAAGMAAVSLILLVVTAAPLDRAHQDVEANRSQTRALVEQAPDGIFVANIEGRYTDVNDAGCRMLQYSREEIIGKTIVDLLPPEDIDRLWVSRELLLQGTIQVDEWRLRRKDGSYVPVEVSARILPDGRWQGFVRDISERKRLEGELRLSEAKSTGILSISADAIISVDADQRITLFNEGAEKIYGYSRTEAVGAPLDMLIPARFRAAHHQHVARFATTPGMAKKMRVREGVVGLRKNGEEFPADAAISNLEVGGSRVLTAVVRDATEQRRTETEQRFLAEVGPVLATTLDYEETLSRIAEMATRGLADFCIVDLVDEKGEVRRVRVVSRDPAKVWICEALQRIPFDHGRPPLVRSTLESTQPFLLPRLTTEDVERLAASDAHRQLLIAADLQSVMVLPLIAAGRLLGAISFLSATPSHLYGPDDLRMGRELAQRAALAVDSARLYRAAQRAIQMRDEVLGIVAHDLRNPLSLILMEARLLGSNWQGPERRKRTPAEVIDGAATRMNRLI
jgi:PAS domain S-box-containing protein